MKAGEKGKPDVGILLQAAEVADRPEDEPYRAAKSGGVRALAR